jgi:hypothetical protein
MFESGSLTRPILEAATGNKCNVWQELHRLGNSSLSSSEYTICRNVKIFIKKNFCERLLWIKNLL